MRHPDETPRNFGNPAAGAYKVAAEGVAGGDEEVLHLWVKACFTSRRKVCVYRSGAKACSAVTAHGWPTI